MTDPTPPKRLTPRERLAASAQSGDVTHFEDGQFWYPQSRVERAIEAHEAALLAEVRAALQAASRCLLPVHMGLAQAQCVD